MNRLISFFFVLIISALSLCAAELPVGDAGDGNAVVPTSSKKLNMRSGPGTSYGIVGQLAPGETGWVTDIESFEKGWVQVSTGDRQGYVSVNFIRSANGNDYAEWVRNYSGPEKKKSGGKSGSWLSFMDGSLGFLNSFFAFLLGLPLWTLLSFFAGAVVVEVVVILLLKRMYEDYRSPWLLYIVIAVGFVLNLAVLKMFPGKSAERYECIVWFMLLLSVFPLLVHSCWRLEQNGKVDNKYYRDITFCGHVGKYLGILAWLVMGLSITSALATITDNTMYGLIPIPDRFWPLVASFFGLIALDAAIGYIWLFILGRLLPTVSNFVSYLLSCALMYVIVMMELEVLSVFQGLYFVIIFCSALLIGGVTCYILYREINQTRCANCHHFSGSLAGISSGGYSTSSRDRWVGIDGRNIRSNGTVRNARELRRTHDTYHHTTHHMKCSYCGNSWDVDNETMVSSRSEALERRWEE